MDPLFLFVFTEVASTLGFLITAGIVLTYLLVRRKARQALAFFATTLGLIVSTQVLKNVLRIPRPDAALIDTIGYAFPSGHAAGATFLFACMCYLVRNVRKPLRYSLYVLCAIAALAIGISRVQLGVHTPLQVVAGFLLGGLWAVIFIGVSKQKSKIA